MTSIPILRYVDIIIGLAVIVLVVCTLVTAITQLILASTYARARHVRDALQDLISQIDPLLLEPHARYIAERLLRHPLVARNNTSFLGDIAWKIRSKGRNWKIRSKGRNKNLPLPNLNPADKIQREEIILLLLEWASGDGALAHQDRELGKTNSTASSLASLREALVSALGKNGVSDTVGTAAAIRARIMQNESDHPDHASQVWRAQAVATAAPKDLAAKIYCWFDNTAARGTQAYSFSAKIWASGIALAIVLLLQLDAVNLLRILARDDKLRADLVAEAEVETRRYEEANDKLKATVTDAQKKDLKTTADQASDQRQQIAGSLAVLRNPNHSIMPSYLLIQPIAHASICKVWKEPDQVEILAGTFAKTIGFLAQSEDDLDRLGAAIRTMQAPVAVYARGNCLTLVAQDAGIDKIEVSQKGPGISDPAKRISDKTKPSWDKEGFGTRLPGILLMWVFVSLGAPFWYDLLKNLLNLRSIMTKKDEGDRKNRAAQQPTGPSAASPSTPPLDATGSVQLQPDLVSTTKDASLRIGTPSTSATLSRSIPPNTLVHVTGIVKGDDIQAEFNRDKDK
jgi:hypothetical protein